MRSAELLMALSQAQGGIEVVIEHGSVKVATHYANAPNVTVEADNLFDAAFECARQIREDSNEYPSFKQFHPRLIEALDAYDDHSGMLSL